MCKIIRKTQLSESVFRLDIESPLIAKERAPGQFVILSVDDEYGERIPLTIADADAEKGTVSIIFQSVGKTTCLLANMNEGDYLASFLGPLGNPTHIENVGHVVCVGGGIGIAPLYPIAQALKNVGNKLTVILGARTSELLILEDEMRALTDNVIICTDDGSKGKKGLVTEPLKELCEKSPKPDLTVTIGPPIMMKFCAATTKPFNIPTVVSLNSIMIDGTGMCGGCRVTVGGERKFVCVDGQEFDGHKVDFKNLIARLNSFKDFENKSSHSCMIDSQIKRKEQN
jgi:ferredoxin--NADP+ reductase